MLIDEDLIAAPATPLVLSVLCEGDSYGFAILQRVRELAGGELEWGDGLVYPLFHRLRRLGYLQTEWRTLPEGRRRRFYTITEDGRAALTGRERNGAGGPRGLTRMWRSAGWLSDRAIARPSLART